MLASPQLCLEEANCHCRDFRVNSFAVDSGLAYAELWEHLLSCRSARREKLVVAHSAFEQL